MYVETSGLGVVGKGLPAIRVRRNGDNYNMIHNQYMHNISWKYIMRAQHQQF